MMIPMPANAKRAHDDLAAKVAAMDMLLQTLARDNAQLRTKIAAIEQRDAPARPGWIVLKAADRGQFSYEAVRHWAETGVIVAEKRAGRWFVSKSSLATHLAQLSAA
jgi:hypothetical protein